MAERVTMPALGESVTEGTVTRWLKSVGDEVAVDEPLLEVSTDKVDTEIPSPVAGVLTEILAEEDDVVEVGGELAVIGDEGESASSGDDGASDDADEADEEPAQEDEAQDDSADESDQADEEPAQDSGSAPSGEGETVAMPALGESVTEGTITRWLKAEGDEVAVDEPLVEVSTDKVDTEVPSPAAGVLSKILADEDETVEVGADLCVIGGSGGGSSEAPKEEPAEEQAEEKPEPEAEPAQKDEPKDEQPKEEPKEAPKEAPKQEKAEPKKEQAPSGAAPRATSGESDPAVYVTPLVRKLAQQHGVDLASVSGTGVGGRIRKQDVLDAARNAESGGQPAAAAQPAPQQSAPSSSGGGQVRLAAQRGSTEKMSRLRKVIAERMVESLQVSAQLTTVVEVDVTKVARLREKNKAEFQRREGVKLSFLPFLALAAIEALKEHAIVNASVEGDSIVYHAQENLGMAVDTDKGLIVPVIKDAGQLNIAGLAHKIADLADRTRNNKIGPDELSGATFTLTNTGSRGALFDTPIINQPNVAILGTGAVVRRPVVVQDEEGGETIAIRSMLYLALSYDHRVVDGADAARFLGTMKERLEEGAFEV